MDGDKLRFDHGDGATGTHSRPVTPGPSNQKPAKPQPAPAGDEEIAKKLQALDLGSDAGSQPNSRPQTPRPATPDDPSTYAADDPKGKKAKKGNGKRDIERRNTEIRIVFRRWLSEQAGLRARARREREMSLWMRGLGEWSMGPDLIFEAM